VIMIIRRAEIDDLQRIQELNLLLFQKEIKEYDDTLNETWTFSEIGTNYYSEKITSSDGFVAVAEIDGQIVGYLVGGISESPSYRKINKIAELENMLVLEKFRGKGCGSRLIESFIQWSREK